MDLGLAGKVALVTAASKGMGRACAMGLAAEGARVVMCARTEADLKAAAEEIRAKTKAEVVAMPADVTKKDDVAALVDRALKTFGGVDILVANAGGPPRGYFEEMSDEQWQGAFDVLLASAVGLIRAVLPGMKERRFGRILNVTSITVKQPVENLILSNALRAAVTGMARTLASEVASFGITVNNVLPGYTRTERLEELAEATARRTGETSAEFYARLEREIPMRRVGDPRELAALCAFLASERASYVTAQSIAADGGWIRGLF